MIDAELNKIYTQSRVHTQNTKTTKQFQLFLAFPIENQELKIFRIYFIVRRQMVSRFHCINDYKMFLLLICKSS